MKITIVTYHQSQGFSEDLPTTTAAELLILIFGDSRFIQYPSVFQKLKQQYPFATFMGCSSAGEISGSHIQDNSLSIAIIQFEHTALKRTQIHINAATNAYQLGKTLAAPLLAPQLKAIFVLSDGLHVNGSELTEGLNAAIPPNIPITGGLAGDGERFLQTWVLDANGMPQTHIVTALGLYGDIQVRHGSQGGWKAFGLPREITRAVQNVLYELDGKPALSVYKTYLGELAAQLPAAGLRFPLAISHPDDPHRSLVRTILAVNETDQSLTFAGNMPEGSQAQLMRANIDQLVEGAETAAILSATRAAPTVLCIAISCIGRRMVMGSDAEEELEAVLQQLPPNTQQIGFYSYGEISPCCQQQCHCDLHNQTMTITTLWE